ncbi:hypothetical protein L914_16877 [Phytophthora nicotianae]|uniref:Transposase Tc1-like domain-containing protein n=1 Tax=Phytophthora nicotianae TaxID=4792 RepID=W2ML90_PHYNI|nr:hypothetical protein L914_16877 [Phytophthora nicotianae]
MARATGIPDIPEETRQAIALYLADWSACGRIKRGAASAAAKRFGCCRQQASKFFKERLKDLPTAKRGRPSAQVDTTRIARRVARVFATPLRRRWTLRALAHSVYIPKTTLLRYMSKQFVKRVTVRVKPTLSAEHKRRRGKRRAIFVQQDNARPHVVEYDPVVAAAGVQYVIKHHGKNDYKF